MPQPHPERSRASDTVLLFTFALGGLARLQGNALKGRVKDSVVAPGPLIETHGEGEWPLVRGSLEKVVFEPGLEGCN